ncbi:putative late blight resistance protein homolog R1A-10 [Salvia splendens]|uniref:putative late blight resistance protein homolog R1A-10 n=1 Tax=Salvia splendens TaxID=180675 RepID=UPI001C25DBC5|nr:putative late blight resistance protein homolog R1A-10 [Salvia splendens]
MAYAALVSLTNTINQTLNSNLYSISLEENQQITPLLEYVTPFQDFLDNFPDKFNSLEGRMRDLANAAEDILEYLALENVYPTPDEDHPSEKHELAQLQNVIKEIDLIDKEVNEIEDTSRYKSIQRGAHSSSSTSTAPLIHKDDMVCLEEYVLDLKDRICGEPSKKLYVIPICGMGGIGKTTLAKSVYDDQLIMEKFEIRVWVTISQDYSAQRILSNILECLKEFNKDEKKKTKDEKKKTNDDVLVHQILMGRRYLVVMDDMWSTEAWDIVRGVLPDNGNGSRVMLTTRLYGVASYPDPSCKLYELGLLDADQSWNHLKQKVFADEDFPRELESIGKEIAGRCKGLPLAIVVIAGLLSTARRDRASWKNIAENVKLADTVEHGQIGDILSLSYVHLPQYLRPCFLYMGSFPEDHEIQAQKLIKLWVAEGFVRYPIDSESFEKVGEECLEDLVKRNLVLITKRKCNGGVKSCRLHDLMRDFCIRKAHEIF